MPSIQVKQIHGLIERKQNEDAASLRVTSEALPGVGTSMVVGGWSLKHDRNGSLKEKEFEHHVSPAVGADSTGWVMFDEKLTSFVMDILGVQHFETPDNENSKQS